jgi:hypothetical protein
MTDSEITTTILRQIRDEIIATRTELKSELKSGLGELKSELTVTNDRLSLLEHAMSGMAGQLAAVKQYVQSSQGSAIQDLRKRVTRLEKKVG